MKHVEIHLQISGINIITIENVTLDIKHLYSNKVFIAITNYIFTSKK